MQRSDDVDDYNTFPLVISLLPSGPSSASTVNPADFNARLNDPFAQYVTKTAPGLHIS